MIGTLKRVIYTAVGLAFIGLGVFTGAINGSPIQPWSRVLCIAGGLFFFYCGGVMYYLPQNRRRRKELDDLLDEAESEIRDEK